MTEMVSLMAVAAVVALVVVAFVASYVISYVRAIRREYRGARIFSTWRLVKMALQELVGRKS